MGGFLLPGSLCAKDRKTIKSESRRSIVQIFTELESPKNGSIQKQAATGVIVSSEGHILTTLHAFQLHEETSADQSIAGNALGSFSGKLLPFDRDRIKKITVRVWQQFSDDLTVDTKAQVFQPQPLSDLILIKVPNVEPTPAAELCATVSPEGELYAFGFARGLSTLIDIEANLQGTNGSFAGLSALWEFSSESDMTYGMSGGPILNREGRVVSLVEGGLSSTSAVRWGIPIGLASPLLKQAGLPEPPLCATPPRFKTALSLLPIYPDLISPLDGYPAATLIDQLDMPIFEGGADTNLILSCDESAQQSFTVTSLSAEVKSIQAEQKQATIDVSKIKALGATRVSYLSVVLRPDGIVNAFWTQDDEKINPVKRGADGAVQPNLLNAKNTMVSDINCSVAGDRKWNVHAMVSLAEVGAAAIRFKFGLRSANQTFDVLSDWMLIRRSFF
jgi:hypothetical protein